MKTLRIILILACAALVGVTIAQAAAKKKASEAKPVAGSPPSSSEASQLLGAPETDASGSPSVSAPLDEKGTAPVTDDWAPSTDFEVAQPSPIVTPAAPATYEIGWQSVSLGAVSATSANYAASASAGQTVVGASQGATTQALAGYWYGASGDPCSCPCQYDPRCDGIISDVLDVSDTINRAFRGFAPTQDPKCSFERTDVDGSGASDVLDVTKVINVAFRGNPAGGQYDLNLCVPGDQ